MQSRFAAALHPDEAPPPTGVASWTGLSPTRRFDVHRGNIRAGLSRALAARFPATEALVGAAFFSAMAARFAQEHPPRSPVLHEYGDEFPSFVAGFAPASSLPYLSDVARLEAARSKAFHAEDAEPLAPAAFAALPPDALPALTFTLHPSATVVASAHPVVTIWAMNAGGAPLAPIETWAAETALVLRPRLSVVVHPLSAGGGAFVDALVAGLAFGPAVAAAQAAEPALDVAALLAHTIAAGLFAGIV